MTDSAIQKSPIWFIVVGILALIWNIIGIMTYISQAYMSEELIAQLPEADQQLFANLPTWYTGAFAIAVFAGTLGSLALVMKKKWAIILLLASLIAAVAQMSYLTFVLKMANTMTALVVIIGFALVLLAKSANNRGWLS